MSSDEDSINKAKIFSYTARDNSPHYEHTHIGFNYRLSSNVSAAIGLGQIEILDKRVKKERNF